MAQKANLLGSGIAAQAANNIVGNGAAGLTATGSTQGTALALTDVNEFTTVAASTGGRLPSNASLGDTIIVYNGGANALSVYPPTGESINALSANAAFSMAANKYATFTKVGATRWASNLTA